MDLAAKRFLEEIPVSAKEGWASQCSQQCYDFFVLHAFAPEVMPNLGDVDAP